MPTEETLVLVKPDGVARGLTGAILARIEAKGYAFDRPAIPGNLFASGNRRVEAKRIN